MGGLQLLSESEGNHCEWLMGLCSGAGALAPIVWQYGAYGGRRTGWLAGFVWKRGRQCGSRMEGLRSSALRCRWGFTKVFGRKGLRADTTGPCM